MKKISTLLLLTLYLSGCATAPPKQPDDICKIFEEKEDWYFDAKDAQDKWGSPKHVLMAMMYQESSFKHDAAPPMEYFLGFIPIGRASDAYGYSQAKTLTWEDYTRETDNGGADRDDFDDAIDFMAWFVWKTHQVNGVSKWDAYAQYLNYHEGWGGFKRGTHNNKKWLLAVANKVKQRAGRYGVQLKRCEADLDKSWLERLFS
ncbi:transglycosylase SLT domain-containing protein [Pseudoalteromonas sp. T1lg75]|uniref:transglycosylase SLT domain-containing protein n=1 Tax=Pseudoalteromonas sp. T1lg75 TaxID=2077102 RepID=UPI000CF61CF9|nr:transglycosylase SLT domain-containing protein [Pseudoalteromonas sp. T1lg75]